MKRFFPLFILLCAITAGAQVSSQRVINRLTDPTPGTCSPGYLYHNIVTGALFRGSAGSACVPDGGGGGSGDVVGPASATDNAIVRYNLTTGKLVQNSAVTIADTTGNISGPQKLTLGTAAAATGSLEFNGTTSGTVTVKPADAAGTWTLTLPANDGDADQFLKTNGSGVTSWAAGGGGITNGAGNNVLTKSDGTNLVASRITDDATNILLNIGNAAAGTVQFGGTDGTRPGLRTNGTNLEVVLANQSAFSGFKVDRLAVGDVAVPSVGGTVGFLVSHVLEVGSELSVLNTSDAAYLPMRMSGVRLMGTANLTVDTILERSSAGVIGINGVTSSFPALRNTGTQLEVVLADISAWAPLKARQLTVDASSGAAGGFLLGNVAAMRADGSGTVFVGNVAETAYVPFQALSYRTGSNCADSAGAAACGSAAAGAVVIDAAATTVVVSTSAVTATSRIMITEDPSLATELGITCNTALARTYAVTARTAATSFTITASAAPVTTPACLAYTILN